MGGGGQTVNDPGLVSRTGWEFTYEGVHPEVEGRREALCTLGNGYMGTRGAAPEATADGTHYPGTYVAGAYNRLTTELAGARIDHESLVNLPNWLPLAHRAGPATPAEGSPAPWHAPGVGDVLELRQTLDMRRGTLRRRLRVRDDEGRVTAIEERRIVSMADPHLCAIEQRITPENWSGRLDIRSALDGRVANTNVGEDRLLANQHLTPVDIGWSDGGVDWLEVDTSWSHVRTAMAARTHLEAAGQVLVRFDNTTTPELVSRILSCDAVAGQTVTVEKVVAVYTSRDAAVGRPLESAREALVGVGSFDELLAPHELAWKQMWDVCEIDVTADSGDDVIAAVRLHAFHVLQTAAPHVKDIDASVTARGLHGEGYRGHIFWDELFVFPFLNFRFPDITRALLRYRARRLPAARRQARELGQSGARFPWQSGSDGSEQTPTQLWNPRSGRWMPDNSRRQHHVGLAVAWNVWQYRQATGDYRFMLEHGTELLVEQARFWAGMASFDPTDGRHHIRGVMGPDEYHDGYPGATGQGIDDNAYTNVLVSWLLRRVLELRTDFRGHLAEVHLWERLGVTDEEAAHWHAVAHGLHIPFHDGIISQFAGWDELAEIDWDGYRARYGNIGRLDLILEAEGDSTNRYKLAKQADVLMLFYLMTPVELCDQLESMGYDCDDAMLARTVEYYIERTAHGSTLSRIVYAWVTARIDPARSWELFREALAADIDDTQGGTTPEGIHLGAMAGSLDLLQRCYSGLELRDDEVRFDPQLPPGLSSVAFDLVHRDRTLAVTITPDRLRVEVEPGAVRPVRLGVGDTVRSMAAGEVLSVALPLDGAALRSGDDAAPV